MTTPLMVVSRRLLTTVTRLSAVFSMQIISPSNVKTEPLSLKARTTSNLRVLPKNRRVTAAPQPSDTEPELYLDLGESSFEERDDHFKDQLRRVTAPSSDELDWDEYLQTLSSEQLAKTLSANGYEMTEEGKKHFAQRSKP